MSKRNSFWAIISIVMMSMACSLLTPGKPGQITAQPAILPAQPVNQEVSADMEAEKGGQVALPGEAVLRIPPGSLPGNTRVSIQRSDVDASPPNTQNELISVGNIYKIDLGDEALQQPALLEISFDPARLPSGTDPSRVFLSYYDEQTKQWVFAGGKADVGRQVIVLPISHASWWQPTTWNWAAWIAVLSKTLRFSVVDWIEAARLLTDDCPQMGQYIQVDASQARNVVQGCVERDDPERPELRIVNPKSFFFEIYPLSGGNSYPPRTLLAPGEDTGFNSNLADPSPLVVAAEMTQKSGWYLIVHLLITMLPGANQFGIQGQHVACITERLADVSYFVSAVEALLVEQNGAAAAESLSNFMLDENAVDRFIRAADDCQFGPAATWSFEGIRQIGAAVSTIMSATDYIANYFAGNTLSQVAFHWTQPTTGTELVQIGVDDSLYLRYEPAEWEPFDEYPEYPVLNPAGEEAMSLRLKAEPSCILHDNLGRGTPFHWVREDTNRQIGNLLFRVEAWTDTSTNKPVLSVYQYPADEMFRRIELVIQGKPKLCIESAEAVLVLSEAEIRGDVQPPVNGKPTQAPPSLGTEVESFMRWLAYSLQYGKAADFRQVIDNSLAYGTGMAGGRTEISEAEFITMLDQRLGARPECLGYYSTSSDYIMVWTGNWNPDWNYSGSASDSLTISFSNDGDGFNLSTAYFTPAPAVMEISGSNPCPKASNEP